MTSQSTAHQLDICDTKSTSESEVATFRLDQKLYGFPVMCVQEIIRPIKITMVPLAPSYIEGLFNLRGQITSAICLRSLLGIGLPRPSDSMHIICQVDKVLFSFMADEVGDVIKLSPSDSFSVPSSNNAVFKKFSSSMNRYNSELICVLDLTKIVEFLNLNRPTDKMVA